jgi:hypothetical protein
VSQHLPPEYDKGDERTVGGYAAVHSRPAALEGRDGFSYTLDILTDSTDDAGRPFGAYLLFVQWGQFGAQRVEGHLETDLLTWGLTADDAARLLGEMTLEEAQQQLEALILARDGTASRRRLDVMHDVPEPRA